MNVTLQIVYGTQSLRTAAAWFIPGNSAAEWLDELVRWQVPLAEVRLCQIPGPLPASEPIGLLAAPPAGVLPHVTGRAVGYGVCGGRLYLPVEARIDPEVAESELADLLRADAQLYVWHPTAGLVEISAGEMFGVADLLRAPAQHAAHWDGAVAGTLLNTRLLSIAPDARPTLEELWNESGEDIATRPPRLDELPPSPMESSGGMADKVGRSAKSAIAHVVHWLAEHAPAGADGPTWIDRVDDWARRQLGQIAASLSAERNRELVRLLHLLDTRPDEGLRFALPLAGDAHRGLANPGGRLTEHNVDYNSRRLGGGAADFWDIEQEYRQRLSARYRELANREISLGRYRRAAYIFGQLLGEYSTAAATLADGGHWREAAALYKERLQQPREAARCLKRGGLWTEAIELLEELGEFEQAGDLYRKLEQEDEAIAAYGRAVERRLESNDFLAAAQITERKIHALDVAFNQLVAGLSHIPQARRCLDESFRLLASQMQHDRALAHVDALSGLVGPIRTVPLVVEGLADVATSYPDAKVRAAAADRVRLLAADRLGGASPASISTITAAIARLVPADRLLSRDAQRYVQQRKQPALPVKVVSGRSPRAPHLLRSIELPPADWRAAVATDQAIYVAGYDDDELQAIQVLWSGTVRRPRASSNWKQTAAARELPVLLSVDPHADDQVLLHVVGAQPMTQSWMFPPCDELPQYTTVGSHPGISHRTWAIQHSGGGAVHCIEFSADYKFIVNSYASTTVMSSSWDCEPMPEVESNAFSLAFPFPFLVRDGSTYLAVGDFLWQRLPSGEVQWAQCPSRIRALTGSAPHTRRRIVAALESGGVIRWEGSGDAQLIRFADELVEPTVGLNRGGWLIAANESRVQVYSTHDGDLRFHAETAGPGHPVITVLSARHADQFALCTSTGKVLLYQVPTA